MEALASFANTPAGYAVFTVLCALVTLGALLIFNLRKVEPIVIVKKDVVTED